MWSYTYTYIQSYSIYIKKVDPVLNSVSFVLYGYKFDFITFINTIDLDHIAYRSKRGCNCGSNKNGVLYKLAYGHE